MRGEPLAGVALLAALACACERTLPVDEIARPSGAAPVEVDVPSSEGGEMGWYPAVAIGPTGNLHIAYCDRTAGDLRYGFRGPDGVLRVEVVASYGAVGKYVALAVDDRDRPHIVYHDQDTKYVKYTVKSGGRWLELPYDRSASSLPEKAERHEKLAWGPEAGMGSSLLVHRGRIYALFYVTRREGGRLLLWTRPSIDRVPYGTADAWSEELVDRADGSWSVHTDLEVAGDKIYASYIHWNFVDSELRLASRPLAGGPWRRRVLFPMKKKTPGWSSSLAAEADGGLTIAFTTLFRERVLVARVPKQGDLVDAPVLGHYINRMRMARARNGDLVLAAALTGKGRLGDSVLALYRRHEGRWTRYMVDERRPTAHQLDVAAGPNGEAVVLYFSDGTRSLWLYDETGATREVVRPQSATAPASLPATAPTAPR